MKIDVTQQLTSVSHLGGFTALHMTQDWELCPGACCHSDESIKFVVGVTTYQVWYRLIRGY